MKRIFVLILGCGVLSDSLAQGMSLAGKAQRTGALAMLRAHQCPRDPGLAWDQSQYDLDATATIDQEFTDYPSYSAYQASDVPHPFDLVQQITTYYTNIPPGDWSTLSAARVSIFNEVDTLPRDLDQPESGAVVSATWTDLQDGACSITAAGLNLTVNGDAFWIVLTPITTFATHGQQWRLVAASGILGNPSCIRNPEGAWGFGDAWADLSELGYESVDSAIKVGTCYGCVCYESSYVGVASHCCNEPALDLRVRCMARGKVLCIARGVAPGSTVRFEMDVGRVANAVVNARGVAIVSFADAGSGPHFVYAEGDDCLWSSTSTECP